jgi:hypothetical protein
MGKAVQLHILTQVELPLAAIMVRDKEGKVVQLHLLAVPPSRSSL